MQNVKIVDGFWRESARTVRLFIFSAWIAVPIFIFLMHITWNTLALLIVTIIVMRVTEYFGYTIPVAFLALRAWIAGKTISRRRRAFGKQIN